ncbi:TatD family hydrolase [Francisella adeliensis]|uniref:DNAase n=1 Tax=Francisella adeliensis TaxID=2007306 RepID=A0A2Z4XWR2_9GAMM|nr:TatD family hydrolase [Francisella adeliensis]AXA32932.1 DNAase [Francisella adeliensis]MBK2086431.1 TatD family hydrolase [Francisella adeliensis]MBK2096647.1 TatD family hydrolase [Francisella adeliensis]QIW11157.1 TatD family deoxyribonuclease [Francisella adeliensis]QIW13034.1 TatD family deoxyribonuclease [Francisella adeliensis]
MLLDAHVHTDKYDESLYHDLVNQCQMNDIMLLSVSMCIPSYKKIQALAKKYDFIIPSFGVHPWKADKYVNELDSLDEYLNEANYIGEIGLDKKFLKYAAPYKDQQEVFEYIVSNGHVKDKLLNLHTSGAEIEVLGALEKYNHSKFVIHWYAGSIELMERYLALGGYFSIGVEIMFSKHIQEIAKKVPLDRILVETDNPSSYSWLLGEESNNDMPELLFKVINKICQIKKITTNELFSHLDKNQKYILF